MFFVAIKERLVLELPGGLRVARLTAPTWR
jgi:hypothetical protein